MLEVVGGVCFIMVCVVNYLIGVSYFCDVRCVGSLFG